MEENESRKYGCGEADREDVLIGLVIGKLEKKAWTATHDRNRVESGFHKNGGCLPESGGQGLCWDAEKMLIIDTSH